MSLWSNSQRFRSFFETAMCCSVLNDGDYPVRMLY